MFSKIYYLVTKINYLRHLKERNLKEKLKPRTRFLKVKWNNSFWKDKLLEVEVEIIQLTNVLLDLKRKNILLIFYH